MENQPGERRPSLNYKSAGLDLDVYGQTLAGIAPYLRRTHTPRVLPPPFPPRPGGGKGGAAASPACSASITTRACSPAIIAIPSSSPARTVSAANSKSPPKWANMIPSASTWWPCPSTIALHRWRTVVFSRLRGDAQRRPGPDARSAQRHQ